MTMTPARTPPAGTRCVDCKCCYAVIYAGNAPLCWECDEGKPCKSKTAAAPKPTLPAKPATATPTATPFEGRPMNTRAPKTTRTRVSEETRQAILREPTSISNMKVGRKYGVSNVTVWNIRKKAGLRSEVSSGDWKRKGKDAAAEPAKTPRAATRNTPAAQPEPARTSGYMALVGIAAPLNPPSPIMMVDAQRKYVFSLELTEPELDALYLRLAPEKKAVALGAALLEQLKG